MIRCVDTFSEIPALFPRGVFELAAWRAYAQARFGSGASLFSLLNPACGRTKARGAPGCFFMCYSS